jgi:membrane protein implicated in regulation of membrane protease activity
MDGNSAGHRLSFDEFKLYYESTEKVTDRRLETNRWNYSICIAMLVAIAVLARWSLTTASLLWIGFASIATLSVMAILFCALWVGQIRDFKKLNNAKFMVLNDMAPYLEFDATNPGAVVSYCPFEKEWNKLNELSALNEVGKSNIIALKSSNIEYFIPKAFGLLFGGILLVLAIVLVSNWPPTKLVHSAPQSASPGPAQERRP